MVKHLVKHDKIPLEAFKPVKMPDGNNHFRVLRIFFDDDETIDCVLTVEDEKDGKYILMANLKAKVPLMETRPVTKEKNALTILSSKSESLGRVFKIKVEPF